MYNIYIYIYIYIYIHMLITANIFLTTIDFLNPGLHRNAGV